MKRVKRVKRAAASRACREGAGVCGAVHKSLPLDAAALLLAGGPPASVLWLPPPPHCLRALLLALWTAALARTFWAWASCVFTVLNEPTKMAIVNEPCRPVWGGGGAAVG